MITLKISLNTALIKKNFIFNFNLRNSLHGFSISVKPHNKLIIYKQ